MDVNYSLISAVREGRLERARELIEAYGLSYSQAWSKGYVLLCDAVKNNNTAIAKLLLTSGSKVNTGNRTTNTLLHFAVINGNIEIVKMILEKGAYIRAVNEYGETPLHYAIEKKKLKVTELLLKYGADVNAKDNGDEFLLHVAVKMECLQIVEKLLSYGADVNCVCKGYATLHIAVEKGNKEVIMLLLRRGADVDVQGEDSITPLHIAAKNGYIPIAEDLLFHGACIHSVTLKEGYTPLHFASQLDNEETVKLFLNRGADINVSSKDNLTPLHIATRTGCKRVVKLLLQHGAKVDDRDKDGKTVLYLTVENGSLMMVEYVLKYCPDINDQSNQNSLKIAVLGCVQKYKRIVEVLLDYGLILNSEDANNLKLLHNAVEKGYFRIIEDLLKYGAVVNKLYNSTFKEGFTLLHSAAFSKQDDDDVAKLLVSYGADVNVRDKKGNTPIFYAIENANLKITQLLLSNGANIKDSPELLSIAVKKECIEIVETLLQHDADINASDKYGRTALHFTAFRKIKNGYGCPTKEDPVINMNGEIAKLLLSKGANVDAQNIDGQTAVIAAINNGCVKVVEALLEYVNVKSDITLLSISAKTGNEVICSMLLNKGANVNAKVESGVTALHVSAGRGYQKVTETLLKFGAYIDSRDNYGRTALHIAAMHGQVNVVVTLLEYGSDINVTSEDNCTPLEYAVVGFHSKCYMNNCHENNILLTSHPDICYAEIDDTLRRHIVKMQIANLYVKRNDRLSMNCVYFCGECKEEIASMKSEKINNSNISFYDILAKGTSSLAIYMRNENIVQVLKSEDYKIKFPMYASMIKCNFRKGMERKELLEHYNKLSHFLFNDFPKLPHDCIEEIFSYLSNEDLRILMDGFTRKPVSISNPIKYTGYPFNNVITSSISDGRGSGWYFKKRMISRMNDFLF